MPDEKPTSPKPAQPAPVTTIKVKAGADKPKEGKQMPDPTSPGSSTPTPPPAPAPVTSSTLKKGAKPTGGGSKGGKQPCPINYSSPQRRRNRRP